MTMQIQRTQKHLPATWVGGGAFTNTITGVFVLTRGGLPQPFFVNSSGPLACSHEQALVPILIGDRIIEVTGPKPAEPANPNLQWTAKRVISFRGDEAEVELVEFDPERVPASVWEGLSRYHNRDGRYFTVREQASKIPDKVIVLDYEGRKLIVQGPKEGDLCWKFRLDDMGRDKEPFNVCLVYPDRTPEEIARAPEFRLYSHVSSTWMGEEWRTKIEPQIIAFVKEARSQI